MTLIHHYTDSRGLIGIIESNTIRATNVWFMNDSVEATFGWKRIERFLVSKTPSSPQEGEVIQLALKALSAVVRDASNFLDSYITCFSEKENDLSQWRAYGHDKGFSIGFDSDELDQLAQTISNTTLPLIRKVTYADALQDDILQTNYQQQVLTQLTNATNSIALANAFTVMAIRSVPSLKHPSFQAEDEWRLQFFLDRSTDRVKFRDSAMGVTPYIEIPLCKPGSSTIACIKKVRVGPQRHPDEALRAAQQLLIRNGLDAAVVKPSTIPLRPS